MFCRFALEHKSASSVHYDLNKWLCFQCKLATEIRSWKMRVFFIQSIHNDSGKDLIIRIIKLIVDRLLIYFRNVYLLACCQHCYISLSGKNVPLSAVVVNVKVNKTRKNVSFTYYNFSVNVIYLGDFVYIPVINNLFDFHFIISFQRKYVNSKY